MSKYHMLKTYIKHKKHNFIILLISNKIIIKKNDTKMTVYIYYNTVFNNLYRCNFCQNYEKLYKLYKII